MRRHGRVLCCNIVFPGADRLGSWEAGTLLWLLADVVLLLGAGASGGTGLLF